MELKTFEEFEQHCGDKVYVTLYHYNAHGDQIFDIVIGEGTLTFFRMDSEKQYGEFYIMFPSSHHVSANNRFIVVQSNEVLKGKDYHIFTNKAELEAFVYKKQ